jgi:hypothetical protein
VRRAKLALSKGEIKMSTRQTSGVDIPTVVLVVFVVLKLVGFIDWSWWWVFSPVWITVGLAIFIGMLWGIGRR